MWKRGVEGGKGRKLSPVGAISKLTSQNADAGAKTEMN